MTRFVAFILRLKDRGITGISGPVVVDIINQPGIRRGMVFLHAVGQCINTPVGITSAKNQMQRIGQRNARSGIQRFHMRGIVLRQILWRPVSLGEITVKGAEVANVVRKDVRPGAKIAVILLTITTAKHHIVLTAKQLISAIGKEIYGIYFALAAVPARTADHGVACAIRTHQRTCLFIH